MAGPAWVTMIDAKPVRFPVHCPSVSTAALYFAAPLASMRPWVPADLALLEADGGSTEVVVILTSYLGGPWGSYDTLDVALRVRPAGCTDPRWAGLFFLDAVVNERFPTEVSYWVLGIGHRYGTVDVVRRDDRVAYEVGEDGRHLLSVELPAVPTSDALERRSARIYAHVGGALHAIPLAVDMPAPSTDVSGVALEVGGGRLGGLLADIGLPRRPDAYAWGEGQTVTVHEPLRVVPAQAPAVQVVPG